MGSRLLPKLGGAVDQPWEIGMLGAGVGCGGFHGGLSFHHSLAGSKVDTHQIRESFSRIELKPNCARLKGRGRELVGLAPEARRRGGYSAFAIPPAMR
jgi:hypothetical protein